MSILTQYIHNNTIEFQKKLCIQIPIALEYQRHVSTGKLQPANHKYTCQKTWRALQRLYGLFGSFAQGCSVLKGLFIPLANCGMEVWKELVKMSTV